MTRFHLDTLLRQPAPPLLLSYYKNRYFEGVADRIDRRPKNQVFDPPVPVSSHDQEICLNLARVRNNFS